MPDEDRDVLAHGIGLTDLAKLVAANNDRGLSPAYDIESLLEKIEQHAPAVLAFHGKEAAKRVSRRLGHGGGVRLGLQPWTIGSSRVFIVPSASGANRDPRRLEGKPSRLAWFVALRELLDDIHRGS